MADSPVFDLYAFWRTSATFRVRLALNLKGLVANEKFINMDAGEQRSADYLRINPLGGLPTLMEPGHAPITQSLAILEFLEETQPLPALLPADRHGRARVKKYLTTDGGFDEAAWRRWQTQWFGTGLAAAEQRLANEPQTGLYCHGDVPNIPTVDRIVVQCSTLDAFARAAPSRQVGAPG